MNRFLSLAITAVAFSIPGLAFASPIVSTITATSTAAGQLSGTVTVDPTAGTITSVDLTLTQGLTTFTFDTIHYQTTNAGTEYYFTAYADNGVGPQYILVAFNGASLSNFTANTSICTLANTCGVYGYTSFFSTGAPGTQAQFFTSGTPSATPEPSSLILLGTGVLGLAGTVRRRFKKA